MAIFNRAPKTVNRQEIEESEIRRLIEDVEDILDNVLQKKIRKKERRLTARGCEIRVIHDGKESKVYHVTGHHTTKRSYTFVEFVLWKMKIKPGFSSEHIQWCEAAALSHVTTLKTLRDDVGLEYFSVNIHGELKCIKEWIPKVFHFDNTVDNKLGVPYMVREYIDAETAKVVFSRNRFVPERFYHQLALLLVSLHKPPPTSQRILRTGHPMPLGFYEDGTLRGITIIPNFSVDPDPTNPEEPCPAYEDNAEYFESKWPLKLNPQKNVKALYEEHEWALRLAPAIMPIDPFKNWSINFTLCHPGLTLDNILIDRYGNIKGIVGWMFAQVEPDWVGLGRLPQWLNERNKTTPRYAEEKQKPVTRLISRDNATLGRQCLREGIRQGILAREGIMPPLPDDDEAYWTEYIRKLEIMKGMIYRLQVKSMAWDMSKSSAGRLELVTKVIARDLNLKDSDIVGMVAEFGKSIMSPQSGSHAPDPDIDPEDMNSLRQTLNGMTIRQLASKFWPNMRLSPRNVSS